MNYVLFMDVTMICVINKCKSYTIKLCVLNYFYDLKKHKNVTYHFIKTKKVPSL